MDTIDDPGERRGQGVEFGPLSEALGNESYPITGAEFLDKYGEHTSNSKTEQQSSRKRWNWKINGSSRTTKVSGERFLR